MARIEKQAQLEKKIVDVKEDVVKEVRRRTRQKRPWFTCSLIVLFVIVGLLIWGTWIVAATGLVHIPVFTSLAYELPEPTRSVSPGVPAQTVLQETFSSTLTRRLYEGGGSLENRSLSVTLSEQSLTASLRSLMEESNIEWLDGSKAQVVIDPEIGIELFVPFSQTRNDLGTAVTARFVLSVTQGQLVVTPTHVQVGLATIPDLFIATFLKPFLEAELASLNMIVIGYAQISDINIYERELVVTGELSVEVQGESPL
jgi:energy-coupling factor transporter transmembrane protein EcfT